MDQLTGLEQQVSWNRTGSVESPVAAHLGYFFSRLSNNGITYQGAEALLQALNKNSTILEVW